MCIRDRSYDTCRVWSQGDDGQWQSSHPLEGHTHWVRAMSFSPDGRYFVSASHDKTCRVWTQDDEGQWRSSCPLEGHTGFVRAISHSPDGRYFVTGSYDGTCRVWSRDGAGTWLDDQCVFGKKTTTPLVAGAQERAVEGVGEGASEDSASALGMRL